jgi:hypothetical protein
LINGRVFVHRGIKMKKSDRRQAEPDLFGIAVDRTLNSTAHRKFVGGARPYHLRALGAHELRPMSREEFDERADCSSPDLVAELRMTGFEIPSVRPAPAFDHDELSVECDAYFLSSSDRKKIARLQRAGAKAAA